MIWATVSSWSCFCWLYRASPSLAANNIINLISILTIWWYPCVESSLVLLEEGVCLQPVCSLGKTLLAFALLHFVLQGKLTCYSRYLLISYFCILSYMSNLIKEKYTCIEQMCLHLSKKDRILTKTSFFSLGLESIIESNSASAGWWLYHHPRVLCWRLFWSVSPSCEPAASLPPCYLLACLSPPLSTPPHTPPFLSLFLWAEVKVKLLSRVQLCNPMDCSPPGSSDCGIFQGIILEWVAISFSRGSSQPSDWDSIEVIWAQFWSRTSCVILDTFLYFISLCKTGMILVLLICLSCFKDQTK